MRLLVLGGTGFVGRTVVQAGLARGDQVTVFNRGRKTPPVGVTALVGDRTVAAGLVALSGDAQWDVVVDTWSAAPSAVQDTARLLAGRVGQYTYISSRSVYVYPPKPGLAEDGPLVEATPEGGPELDYAAAKRGGELAALEVFGDRALLVRAGLILGPHEDVGRLPWWLRRIARGGPVVAPGPAELGLQYIDVRDLAEWTLAAAGRGLGGPFNLVSPPATTTMGELLETCVQVTRSGAALRWIAPQVLLKAGVEPWIDLPIWLPPGEDHDGMHGADVSKALETGLRCRPIGQTIQDTWAWLQNLDGEPPQRSDRPRLGLDPTIEARLLGA
ncbi:MAG TPA: NAD-dependent epimerase/dehydratase family protein [Kineosporiaceae bacterium]|nr:NAD-dependent epimerase/dehydratase family protein [Kineosporiaceae bacterium]